MGLDPFGIGSSFCLLFLKENKINEYLVRKRFELNKTLMFEFDAKMKFGINCSYLVRKRYEMMRKRYLWFLIGLITKVG